MGFQDVHEVVHKAASRKGGRIRARKGFAVNTELARSAGSKGGKAKHANKGKEVRPKEEHPSDNKGLLERILTDVGHEPGGTEDG